MQTRRILGATALAAAAAVSLAGCVKMDMQLELQSDDTVDGSMIVAVSSEMAALMGQDPTTIAEELGGDTIDMSEGADVRQEAYDDGEYVGTKITFEGESLTGISGSDDGSLSIVREGDEFVVSGVMDLSAGEAGMEGGDMFGDLSSSFDVRISITFPGRVSDHNGSLDGNTVTWTPSYGQITEISARGSAIEGGGSGLPIALIVGIAAAVLIAAGLIIFFVLRSRKSAAQPAVAGYGYTGTEGYPAQGYAPQGYAQPAAPAQAYPAAPPAAPTEGYAPPAAPPVPSAAPPAPPQQQTPPPPPVA